MRELFNPDNGLFRFLSRLADLMILNVIFLITSIPIITIGAGLTGMSYVTRQMAEGEESYIIRAYWKSFRQNFKQSTIIWLIMFATGCVLGFDIYIVYHLEGTIGTISRLAIYVVTLFYLMEFVFVFPVLARFDNTTRNTIRNAFIMAIADFPRTLVMLVIVAGAVILTFLNAYTIWYGILVWLMCGFATISLLHAFFIAKVFARYIPKDDAEQQNPDHWSVEESMGELPEETDAEAANQTTEASTEAEAESGKPLC